MNEPIPYTDVIDAFDKDDPFDLNAHLGYQRTTDRGTIQREYTDPNSHHRKRGDVADSQRVASQLMFGLDMGLYKDLMAFVRLPLILSDARSLSLPGGKSSSAINGPSGPLSDPFNYGGGSGSLFSVPFNSPTRAGFDYVGIGGAWSLLNQQRKPWQPTWMVLLEGRRAIGQPLRPCQQVSGNNVCGNQAPDGQGIINGTIDGTAQQLQGKSAGSSQGFSGVNFETRLSRRYRYVEPYMGLGVLIQWASTAKKYFNPAGNLQGALNTLPSQQGVATLGSTIIPWENRGKHQRFAIDLRLSSTYYSRGHDYTALFDALGSSNHAELTRPNFEGVHGVPDPNNVQLKSCGSSAHPSNCYVGAKVPFYGITDVQAHLKNMLRIGLDMQAAEYIRFGFGTGLSWVTAHALTSADPCNPGITDPGRSESYRGSTCGSGIVNPNHRPTIDLPGRRFWMTGEMLVDLYATATAQF